MKFSHLLFTELAIFNAIVLHYDNTVNLIFRIHTVKKCTIWTMILSSIVLKQWPCLQCYGQCLHIVIRMCRKEKFWLAHLALKKMMWFFKNKTSYIRFFLYFLPSFLFLKAVILMCFTYVAPSLHIIKLL